MRYYSFKVFQGLLLQLAFNWKVVNLPHDFEITGPCIVCGIAVLFFHCFFFRRLSRTRLVLHAVIGRLPPLQVREDCVQRQSCIIQGLCFKNAHVRYVKKNSNFCRSPFAKIKKRQSNLRNLRRERQDPCSWKDDFTLVCWIPGLRIGPDLTRSVFRVSPPSSGSSSCSLS